MIHHKHIHQARCWSQALGLLLASLAASVTYAGEGDSEYVVVKAGRVITISGEELTPGTIVIEDGKITAVGGDLEYPSGATVIDARSETVMPGLIHPQSRFGLKGYSRSGVHGDQNASSDVYLSILDFEDLLSAGYTTVCFVPAGSDIPGTAAAYRTAGSAESQRWGGARYVQVSPAWKSGGTSALRAALKKAEEEIKKVEKAKKEWDEKKKKEAEEKKESEKEQDKDKKDKKPEKGKGSTTERSAPNAMDVLSLGNKDDEDNDHPEGEAEGKKEEGKPEEFTPPPIDVKYQPLVDLLQEKESAAPLMIGLNRASDWLHLDDVLSSYEKVAYRLTVNHRGRSTDFSHVVEALGKKKVSVVLYPKLNYLPYTTFRYNLPDRLSRAGCEIAFRPLSDSRAELQNVRRRVADVVRAGLSHDKALQALTLNAACAIGLDDHLGTIEQGKDADLAFFDGDPLDPHTKVKRVMILGEVVWTEDDSE